MFRQGPSTSGKCIPFGNVIIEGLNQAPESTVMEAEQLNAISNKLDDLAQRAAELRRYL